MKPLFIFWIIFLLDLELKFIDYRQIIDIPMGTNYAPLAADLFLFCYERDFMNSLSGKIRLTLLRLSIPLPVTIDNIYFKHMVDRIYPAELQLNKANSSDIEAPFLDLNYQYLMVQFPLKFMINGTILILI